LPSMILGDSRLVAIPLLQILMAAVRFWATETMTIPLAARFRVLDLYRTTL